MNIYELAFAIRKLTLAEAGELVRALEGHGIVVELGYTFPASAHSYLGSVTDRVEPKDYNLVLVGYNPINKIQIIKLVRELSDNRLGLREAKELTERMPSIVVEHCSWERAGELARRFFALGAHTELVIRK